jgi:hypothetical protein
MPSSLIMNFGETPQGSLQSNFSKNAGQHLACIEKNPPSKNHAKLVFFNSEIKNFLIFIIAILLRIFIPLERHGHTMSMRN